MGAQGEIRFPGDYVNKTSRRTKNDDPECQFEHQFPEFGLRNPAERQISGELH